METRQKYPPRQSSGPARSLPLDSSGRVFDNFELLEGILQHLNMQTLLVISQLVCKRWHTVVEASSVLQQRLYFRPHATGQIQVASRTERRKNPLLEQHFQPLFEDTISSEHTTHRQGIARRGYAGLGPLQLRVPGMSIANMKQGRKKHKAFVRTGASWRRMLVTQPPIESITYLKHGYYGDFVSFCALQFPRGLRMGEFHDLIFSCIWLRPEEGIRLASISWSLYGSPSLEQVQTFEAPIKFELAVMQTFYPYSGEPGGGCAGGKCTGHTYRYNARCWELRRQYLRTRGRSSTRWMFECEEFVEEDLITEKFASIDLSACKELYQAIRYHHF